MMNRYRPEQIVEKLRQAEVELGKGRTVRKVCVAIGVSELTYYRWRQKYGGMSAELIRELAGLERENRRLRKLAADRRGDTELVKEAGETAEENS